MNGRDTMLLGPTFEEMLHPQTIAPAVRARALAAWRDDPFNPLNLYNITWRGADGSCYYDLLPPQLTGVAARIVVLCGCRFPTGSHKVGAAYAVLAEAELAGDLKPGQHLCVWPSTGNYGIGGTWVGRLMGFENIVVLPESVSAERFELLRRYGARIVATPGGESNVREVQQACAQLCSQDPDRMRVLNQFQALANYRFHYYVTGNAVVELAAELAAQGIGKGRIAAFVSAMGSGGTIAAGDRIKQAWSDARIVGLEPIQCPALFNGGYGAHDIQGIGDKQVTWIHNVMNMDALMAIDELECKQGLQLLTEEAGWKTMTQRYGVPDASVQRMAGYFGVSGVCNVLGAIKAAQFYGLGPDDLVVTVCTDGLDRYRTVMAQMTEHDGPMDETDAAVRLVSIFHKQKLDWIQEGSRAARQVWHHRKYYTWVEQQGKPVEELEAQRSQEYWLAQQAKVAEIDQQILDRRSA